MARDVYSVGIANISNSTQSTTTTNEALVVSGGIGVGRNSHFGGTIHKQMGTAASPGFVFLNDSDTGIFQNGANVVGIAANGSLGVSHSAKTSTINNVLGLLITGSVSAATLNFCTANTGLFSSSSAPLKFTVAVVQQLNITGSLVSYALPIQLTSGA